MKSLYQTAFQNTETMKVFRWMLFVFFITPFRLSANGGPSDIAWTAATPTGGVVLKQILDVGLKSESLHIVIDPDGQHYQVTAEYHLKNWNKPMRSQYSVPVSWSHPEPPKYEWQAYNAFHGAFKSPEMILKPSSSAQKMANSIRISTQDRSYGCTLLPSTEVEGLIADSARSIESWCTAEIEIPSGEFQIRLTYQGELEFDDLGGYPPSSRILRYALFPAGGWRGPVSKLQISVDTGPLAEFAQILSPAPQDKPDRKLRWEFKNIDLRTIPWLIIQFNNQKWVKQQLLMRDIMDHNARIAVADIRLRASSTKNSEHKNSFAIEGLLDGNPDSNWCSDMKDHIPSIEIHLSGLELREPDDEGGDWVPKGIGIIFSNNITWWRIKSFIYPRISSNSNLQQRTRNGTS